MGRPKGTKFQRALSLRLEGEMWDVLERMAVEEERPIGMMARIVLREGLEAREAKGLRKKGKKLSQEG
jgi:hypothetical protein